MAPSLAWYGHLTGPSSAPVVSRGFVETLRAAGVRVEAVDLRRPPRDIARRVQRLREGHTVRAPEAPGFAVVHGFPEWSAVVPRHECLWGYLWAEADTVPDAWPPALNALDGVFTDSGHTASVLEAAGVTTPLVPCPHGIGPEFVPSDDGEPSNGTFRWLHFCAGDAAAWRKGTFELLRAWDRVSEAIPDGRLVLVTSSRAVRRAVGELTRSWTVELLPEAWRPAEAQARLLQAHHVLVAPSRAEGFGRLGPESLCCGVPIVATACTGHAEWAQYVKGGMVQIPTGPPAALYPTQGRAPIVEPGAIGHAMLSSYYQYGNLRAEALEGSPTLRERLSWQRAVGPLLERLGHGQRHSGP